MRRREFLQGVGAGVGAAICSGALTSSVHADEPPGTQPAPLAVETTPLGSQRHLFIDDFLTSATGTANVTYQVHPPAVRERVLQAGKVVLDPPDGGGSWEGFTGYHSVVDDFQRDTNGNIINDGNGKPIPEAKMYYENRGRVQDNRPSSESEKFAICVATSQHGLTWIKPVVGRYSTRVNASSNATTTHNNIVLEATRGSVFCDNRPGVAANEKYKFISGTSFLDGEGILMCSSPDGEHFSDPVTILPYHIDSQPVMYWDRFINMYVTHLRGWEGRYDDGSDAPLPIQNEQAPTRPHRTVVRAVCNTANPMGETWAHTPIMPPALGWMNDTNLPMITTQIPQVLSTDTRKDPMTGEAIGIDPIETDLYGGQVTLYPQAYKVYLAFPTFYYHFKGDRQHLDPKYNSNGPPGFHGNNSGTGEVQLCVSRDGINWKRYPRTPYLKGGWHSSTYCGWPWVIQGMVFRHGKIYQYARMRTTGHDGIDLDPESATDEYAGITRLEQEFDRFVAAEFAYTGGTLTTKPFTFVGNVLRLNFDTSAMGEGRVAILQANGDPYTGFSAGECEILHGDHFTKVVTWKRGAASTSDVSPMAGSTVSLRFEMRGTNLYAFQFATATA